VNPALGHYELTKINRLPVTDTACCTNFVPLHGSIWLHDGETWKDTLAVREVGPCDSGCDSIAYPGRGTFTYDQFSQRIILIPASGAGYLGPVAWGTLKGGELYMGWPDSNRVYIRGVTSMTFERAQ